MDVAAGAIEVSAGLPTPYRSYPTAVGWAWRLLHESSTTVHRRSDHCSESMSVVVAACAGRPVVTLLSMCTEGVSE